MQWRQEETNTGKQLIFPPQISILKSDPLEQTDDHCCEPNSVYHASLMEDSPVQTNSIVWTVQAYISNCGTNSLGYRSRLVRSTCRVSRLLRQISRPAEHINLRNSRSKYNNSVQLFKKISVHKLTGHLCQIDSLWCNQTARQNTKSTIKG